MPDGPTFVGVGSRLSGWRRWARLLAEHPAVEFPARTGRRFDLAYFQRFCETPMTDADAAAYRRLFPAREGIATGEWTTRYMTDPWVMPLLARAAPEARIVVLLADPVMRYRTWLAYWPEELDGYRRMLSIADAVERGRYAEQLRLVYECFDPSRVLVLQQERCEADPVGQYRRLTGLLGVDQSFVPRSMRRIAAGKPAQPPAVRALGALGVNRRVPERVRRRLGLPVYRPPATLWPDLELALHDELDAEMAALAAMLPEIDLSLWPSFAHLAAGAAEPEPAAAGPAD